MLKWDLLQGCTWDVRKPHQVSLDTWKVKRKRQTFGIVKLRDVNLIRTGSKRKWTPPSASMLTTPRKEVSCTSHSWEYCLPDYNSLGEAEVEEHCLMCFLNLKNNRIRKWCEGNTWPENTGDITDVRILEMGHVFRAFRKNTT